MAKTTKLQRVTSESLINIDGSQQRTLARLEKKWETRVSPVRETIRETERLGEDDYSVRINTKG